MSRQTKTPEMQLFHSMAYKRSGDWKEAVSIWQELAGTDGSEGLSACLELAKYYEHRAKDISTALEYTQKAQKLAVLTGNVSDDLSRRTLRLKCKLTV